MERVEGFQHQNKPCWRRELPGSPLEVAVETRQALYGGKEYTRTLRRWKGRHLLSVGEEVREVDESLVTDCGPKLGISLSCIPHRGGVAAEEREENCRRIVQTAAQLMQRADIGQKQEDNVQGE